MAFCRGLHPVRTTTTRVPQYWPYSVRNSRSCRTAFKFGKNLPGLVNTLLDLIIRGPLSTVRWRSWFTRKPVLAHPMMENRDGLRRPGVPVQINTKKQLRRIILQWWAGKVPLWARFIYLLIAASFSPFKTDSFNCIPWKQKCKYHDDTATGSVT